MKGKQCNTRIGCQYQVSAFTLGQDLETSIIKPIKNQKRHYRSTKLFCWLVVFMKTARELSAPSEIEGPEKKLPFKLMFRSMSSGSTYK